MKIEALWNQFSRRQSKYLGNIVANSDAKTVCDIGAFAGSVSRCLWEHIKDTDKELYMIDNYLFLPQKWRQPFFNTVKKTVGNSERIHTVLENSHTYDWCQHDFVVFSHESFAHYNPDLKKLYTSNVDTVVIDLPLNCFERTKSMLEHVQTGKLTPRYYIDGTIVCGKDTVCTLPTESGELFGHPIQYAKKAKGSYANAIDHILDNFNV